MELLPLACGFLPEDGVGLFSSSQRLSGAAARALLVFQGQAIPESFLQGKTVSFSELALVPLGGLAE